MRNLYNIKYQSNYTTKLILNHMENDLLEKVTKSKLGLLTQG